MSVVSPVDVVVARWCHGGLQKILREVVERAVQRNMHEHSLVDVKCAKHRIDRDASRTCCTDAIMLR